MLRAAAKNFAHVVAVSRPDAVRRRAGRARATARSAGDATPARAGGVRAHRRLRRRHRGLALRRRGLPGPLTARARQVARPRLRREPAPARGVLRERGARRPPALAASSSCTAASSRSSTSTTSPPRAALLARVRGAGLRDRQAREPVRRRRWRHDRGGVPPRARRRPAVRVRARLRGQPARERRARGASSRSSSSTCCSRRATTTRRWRRCAASRTPRILRGERRAGDRLEREARARRPARPGRDATSRTATSWSSSAASSTEAQLGDLRFAWRVCKHVTSNAIVIARDRRRSASAPASRAASTRSGSRSTRRATAATTSPAPSLASDAFFPFPDGPQLALDAGATAIVQPGGSKRDEEVDRRHANAGAAMVLTHRRHFRH